jgi:hypothetical protein
VLWLGFERASAPPSRTRGDEHGGWRGEKIADVSRKVPRGAGEGSECRIKKLYTAFRVVQPSRPTGLPRIPLVHRAEHVKSAPVALFFREGP